MRKLTILIFLLLFCVRGSYAQNGNVFMLPSVNHNVAGTACNFNLFVNDTVNGLYYCKNGTLNLLAGSGTVTSSGSPVVGNIPKFTSATNIAPATYTDITALWTACTGYLKSDGTCSTNADTLQSHNAAYFQTALTSYSTITGLWTTCNSGWLKYDGTCTTPSGTLTASGTPAQYDMSYWTSATNLTKVTAPTTQGLFLFGYNLPTNGAVAPTVSLAGITNRSITGTTSTDTILFSDQRVEYIGSVAVAVTLPNPSALENAHLAVRLANHTTGTATVVTVTPTTWTINGGSSIGIAQGVSCLITTGVGTDWSIDCSESQITANTGVQVARAASGLTIQQTTASNTRTVSFSDLGPVAGDDGLIVLLNPATAIHITRFSCGVTGTTSVVANIDKTVTTALIADTTCTAGDANQVAVTTFDNTGGRCGGTTSCAVAAHVPVTLHIGTISGTPTSLSGSIDYTVD